MTHKHADKPRPICACGKDGIGDQFECVIMKGLPASKKLARGFKHRSHFGAFRYASRSHSDFDFANCNNMHSCFELSDLAKNIVDGVGQCYDCKYAGYGCAVIKHRGQYWECQKYCWKHYRNLVEKFAAFLRVKPPTLEHINPLYGMIPQAYYIVEYLYQSDTKPLKTKNISYNNYAAISSSLGLTYMSKTEFDTFLENEYPDGTVLKFPNPQHPRRFWGRTPY